MVGAPPRFRMEDRGAPLPPIGPSHVLSGAQRPPRRRTCGRPCGSTQAVARDRRRRGGSWPAARRSAGAAAAELAAGGEDLASRRRSPCGSSRRAAQRASARGRICAERGGCGRERRRQMGTRQGKGLSPPLAEVFNARRRERVAEPGLQRRRRGGKVAAPKQR